MKKPHGSVHPGKRVRVRLKDGTRFDDRFLDCNDRYLILERHGKLFYRDLKALIPLKTQEALHDRQHVREAGGRRRGR